MRLDPDRLLSLSIPDVEHHYTEGDVILYALGVGYGMDPGDERQLRFVLEDRLLVAPTFATVVAKNTGWITERDTGIDYARIIHGEHHLTLHAPLPADAVVVGRARIADIFDQGPGRNALVVVRREIHDKGSGLHLASETQTIVCRGQGGFAGPPPPISPFSMPTDPPTTVRRVAVSPQAALIYRLSGDRNPLHADPRTAERAGFPMPILHGLATFGIAARQILSTCDDWSAGHRLEMSGRFVAPVYPGETLRTEIWADGNAVRFRLVAEGREAEVFARGYARTLNA